MPAAPQLEPAPCPVCGPSAGPGRELFTAQDHLFGFPGDFALRACPECGTWRVNPRPRLDDLGLYYSRYYSPAGIEVSAALQVGTGNPRFDPVRSTSLQRWREILRALGELRGSVTDPAQLTAVDAGCGLGGFLHHLAAAQPAPRRIGVELSPEAVRYARETLQLDVLEAPVEALPLPDHSVDVLSLWHVLEHSPDPQRALAEAHRVLRPDGVLAVELPSGDSLLARVFRARWFYLQPPTHLQHFTRRGLDRLLEGAGFRVLRRSQPFVPLELLGSLYYALLRPKGLPQGEKASPWKALAMGLSVLLLEAPLLALLRLLRRGGVMRTLAAPR